MGQCLLDAQRREKDEADTVTAMASLTVDAEQATVVTEIRYGLHHRCTCLVSVAKLLSLYCPHMEWKNDKVLHLWVEHI